MTSKSLAINILLLANLNLLAATVSVMAEPALEPVCANAIGIVADPKDARQLRNLLQKGSLARLRTEACNHYEARLARAPGKGWIVSMTSSNSPRRLERQVANLEHASTWIEAWTQTGFAPAPEAMNEQVEPVATAPATSPSAVPGLAAFMNAGPTALVTTRGYGLAGGSMQLGLPALHTPFFGATLGLATQVAPSDVEYRRVFWAGPLLGADIPLATNLRLRPAVSTGVFGASAKNADTTASSVGAYVGMGSDLVWDLNAHLAWFVGVEGQFIFSNFLGGKTQFPKHHHDDDNNDPGAPPVMVDPEVGLFNAGLRLGVTFRFGA